MTDLEKVLHKMENSLNHLEKQKYSSRDASLGFKNCMNILKEEMIIKLKKRISKNLNNTSDFCIKFKNPYLKNKKFILGSDGLGYYFITCKNDNIINTYKSKKKKKIINKLSQVNLYDHE